MSSYERDLANERLLNILEVKAWIETATTSKVLKALDLHLKYKIEELVTASLAGNTVEAAKLAGQIELLKQLLNLDNILHFVDSVEMLIGEESDAEGSRG